MSVIKGDQIKIKNIAIESLYAHVTVLENECANWDIIKPSMDKTTPKRDTSKTNFSLSLKRLTIQNANLIYEDKKNQVYI